MNIEDIKEAIEVLEDASAEMLIETGDKDYYSEAIAILRQAIEQAEREWFDCTDEQLINEVRRRGFVIRDAQIEQSEHVHAVNTSKDRVDEIVKQEHDRAVELGQAYERGWNAALAQQEPVAWMGAHDKTDLYYRKPPQADVIPLYTAPPKKEWVGLTEKEWYEATGIPRNATLPMPMLKGIEKALKEKNT